MHITILVVIKQHVKKKVTRTILGNQERAIVYAVTVRFLGTEDHLLLQYLRIILR
jgi:hypothetical protein